MNKLQKFCALLISYIVLTIIIFQLILEKNCYDLPKSLSLKKKSYYFIRSRACASDAPFKYFLYNLDDKENSIAKELHQELDKSLHKTKVVEEACLFVYIVSNAVLNVNTTFWKNYEEDHLIILIRDKDGEKYVDTGQAMVVSERFDKRYYRDSYDLTAFLNVPKYDPNYWKTLPKLSESINKTYLFYLEFNSWEYSSEDQKLIYNIRRSCLDSKSCIVKTIESQDEEASLMDIGNKKARERILRNATFTIILPNQAFFQQKFYEALQCGSIPVVMSLSIPLPFQDLIDWRNGAVRLPEESLLELSRILHKITLYEILELRRKGRFYWEFYLGNAKVLSWSIISAVRYRRNMLSKIKLDVSRDVLRNISARSNNITRPPIKNLVTNDYPYLQTYVHWNIDPTHLRNDYVSPIKQNYLSSDSKNVLKRLKVNNSLGRGYPDERYTIIMLAFKRDAQLKATLSRLNNFTFLDRVIIIWNDFKRDPPPASWWDPLHVDIFVVNGSRNSLNNRFLPYNLIRTEAVFNMDEDYEATNENLQFLFRLWRENRDVLVGPYFRYGSVEEGNKGSYKSGGLNKCEYNLVLTGAAFLHKSYMYSYTYLMPAVIRWKIDELMNCEDIAMNFLVSHLSRKSHIKATPMRDAKGNKTKGSLHSRKDHYKNRAGCIKYLVEVYGYNPLIPTQFKAASARDRFSDCLK